MTDAAYKINDKLWQGAHCPIVALPNRAEFLSQFDAILVVGDWGNLAAVPEARFAMHAPIPDDPSGCSEEIWNWLYNLSHKVVAKDAVVLTVCSMGENRSGLLSAMLLHAREGLKGEDCIAEIRKHAMPHSDQPYTIWNPGFCRQILERLT